MSSPLALCAVCVGQQAACAGCALTSACETSQRAIAVRSRVPLVCEPSVGRLAIATATG